MLFWWIGTNNSTPTDYVKYKVPWTKKQLPRYKLRYNFKINTVNYCALSILIEKKIGQINLQHLQKV